MQTGRCKTDPGVWSCVAGSERPIIKSRVAAGVVHIDDLEHQFAPASAVAARSRGDGRAAPQVRLPRCCKGSAIKGPPSAPPDAVRDAAARPVKSSASDDMVCPFLA